MSIASEAEVAGGGSRCFGANVPITAANVVSRLFVVIAPSDTGQNHKAVVFDDLIAMSVMCITLDHVNQLRLWTTTGQARMVVAESGDVTAEVAQIITCPPPDSLPDPDTSVSVRITDPRLDVSQKLDSLTVWGRALFGEPSALAPAKTSTAA